jgi:hypothetical protein
VFFRFTSLPYTEGLAFALLLGALLAVDRAAMPLALERESAAGVAASREAWRSYAWSALAGALAALALLTRGQMAPALVAIPLALALAAFCERRMLGQAAVALLSSLVLMAPWILYLTSWIDELSLTVALGFATIQETPGLEAFRHVVDSDGLWSRLADRAGGAWVAFDPKSEFSYVASFGAAAYLAPLALCVAILGQMRAGSSRSWKRWLAADRVLLNAALLCGLGMLLPVHDAHQTFFKEWLFGHRHGLPLLLLLLPAFAYLVSHRNKALRILASLLLLAGVASSVHASWSELSHPRRLRIARVEPELIAWLHSQRPLPTVVSPRAQYFGAVSLANYHWTTCDSPGSTTLALLQGAGADYVVVFRRDLECAFFREARPQLRLVHSFGRPPQIYVYESREDASPEGGPAPP